MCSDTASGLQEGHSANKNSTTYLLKMQEVKPQGNNYVHCNTNAPEKWLSKLSRKWNDFFHH